MVFFQLNVTGLLFQSFRTASPPFFFKKQLILSNFNNNNQSVYQISIYIKVSHVPPTSLYYCPATSMPHATMP